MGIDFKLAKELKDAGFPQGDGVTGIYATNDNPVFGGKVYIPSLSELIRICGRKFYTLRHAQWAGGWYADLREMYPPSFRGKKVKMTQFGKTPEEAVARVWLESKRKKQAKPAPTHDS